MLTGVYTYNVLLILGRALEDVELALHHVGTHVVVLALANTLEEKFGGRVEEDEMDQQSMVVVSGHADDITVLALEGRTGNDDTVCAVTNSLHGLVAQDGEPVPSVFVCKRNSGTHFINIRFGVVLKHAQGISLAVASSKGWDLPGS